MKVLHDCWMSIRLAKKKIYKIDVRPLMLYESKCFMIKKQHKQKVYITEIIMYRVTRYGFDRR